MSTINGDATANNLVGTASADTLNGLAGNDTLYGGAGNDTLDGGLDNDQMNGGDGDDTYILDSNSDFVSDSSGTDIVLASVSYYLTSDIENLTLTGTDNINGHGNDLNNILIGNSGNNLLDGYFGADTLIGGAGNDSYVVDNIGDVVTEAVNEGVDTVLSYFSYTLGANLENLTLNGESMFNANLDTNGTGNDQANMISGNSGNNILSGGGGNDTLDGSTGADTLIGGTGNDSYVVDNIGDVVTEAASEGVDSVLSSVSYTLSANVENLTLIRGINTNGTGNSLNNVLIGSYTNNVLSGGAGNDTLDGSTGADTLIGGMGNDVYVVDNALDVVTEDAGAGTDTVQSLLSAYTLSANVENLILSGAWAETSGTGNSLSNVITGTNYKDTLDGGTGADTLIGGLGDDTYVIDTNSDVIIEAIDAGTDTVQSSISTVLNGYLENLRLTGTAALNGTGNAWNNVITGNAANNILNGAFGADTMSGGTGNDTYYVDNAGDIVTEAASAGSDTVISSISYKLTANVENLTLTGTGTRNGVGNDLANYIVGNNGNNTLTGGKGNDTYNLGRTSQYDTIMESDATVGNTDTLRFAADVHYDQLWFKQIGNDLEVDIIGTSNAATIKNFFYSTSSHIEVFRSGDGKVLTDTRVQNLVSAMAGMAQPATGQTVLTADQQTVLAPVFAANWK